MKVGPTSLLHMAKGIHGRLGVVVPVLNEVRGLRLLLDDLAQQTFPSEMFDVIVLDGGSNDGTAEMAKGMVDAVPFRLQVVDNHRTTVPHARNLAMDLLPDDVEWLVELIGHVRVDVDHLERRVEAWEEAEASHGPSLAAMGVRVLGPSERTGRVEGWVDAALRSPLGRGGGQFAAFHEAGPTKVPAFAMHRRSAVKDVGGWDASWPTSQDSDLSMRLLEAGGILLRDPRPTVRMNRRPTLKHHWRMCVRYGYWRGRLLRRHPSRLDPREFLPLFGALLTCGLWFSWPSVSCVPAIAYVVAIGGEGVRSIVRDRAPSHLVGVPVALLLLHAGFTAGLLRSTFGRPPKARDR